MKFVFALQTEELAALQVYNQWKAPWQKSQRQRLGIIIPIGVVLFGITFITDGHWAPGISVLILGIFLFLYYKWIHPNRLENSAKGYYNHSINEKFWLKTSYHFTSNEILVENELHKNKIQWKAIKNVIEQKNAFWLFETLTDAHIIPKRTMKQGEVEQFKQLLTKRLIVI